MRVLFLVSAHNSLSQRAGIALTDLGHAVAVAVVDSAPAMEAAVAEHEPELIVCPFLKKLIPASIWSQHRCLVVHPGPPGDRGPSALDWAIELGADEWGVTVLEANAEADGGAVWATRTFRRARSARAACTATRSAARRSTRSSRRSASSPTATPAPEPRTRRSPASARPLMTQAVRAIDWQRDSTDT